VESAEGATFGVVPYLNPNVTGTVSGIIGAGGNAGAVIFSVLFRQMEYRNAFFWMGMTTSIVSLLSSFVWIKGYEGLFLKQRVNLAPKEKKAYNTRKTDNQSSLESPDER
jgi:NNP family nitrate/nitrite transporter-like MFS transporter